MASKQPAPLRRVRQIPASRVKVLTEHELNPNGEFVLYWMVAARRTHFNFGLQRAAAWAQDLGRPLLVLEALRVGYPYASDRLHAFILRGMADNARRFAEARIPYYPYVERYPDEGKGLIALLARRAALVVTDDFPAFFLPHMIQAAIKQIPCRFEQIDSNGLLPMRLPDRVFTTAFSFRIFLQKNIAMHLNILEERPLEDPLEFALPPAPKKILPADFLSRFPKASPALLEVSSKALAELPIDHRVSVVDGAPGGAEAAEKALQKFMHGAFTRYDTDRNDPDAHATSGLSPYLHFGHLSVHRILAEIQRVERVSLENLKPRGGKREGFWGMSSSAEAFLDQLVTWRELGLNMCALRPDEYMCYESLPHWAQKTLADHASDRRPALYSREDLELARTGDHLWNAAQRQLVREGRIHNYLRMLWGKRILEWTADPREALDRLIDLNDRYALDGRDPNSYSGIFWTLGRYDRPFGPERSVYGKVRYMSSANTMKKIQLKRYLEEYGEGAR